jgi:hypothetical protein
MLLRYIFISLCLLYAPSVEAQVAAPLGVWRQTNVKWQRPPAELELRNRYAESAVLYFSPDHRFVLMFGTLIQRISSEEMSKGDGRIVYLGTWKVNDNSVHVEYHLVSRTVAIEGEIIPGAPVSDDIQLRGSTLHFKKDRFARDRNLDVEFKATLETETALEGKWHGQP